MPPLKKNANQLSAFLYADETLTVQSFCREKSINIKTFERYTKAYTGFTPKTLIRIMRFQKSSNQLSHQKKNIALQTSLMTIILQTSLIFFKRVSPFFRHDCGQVSGRKNNSEGKMLNINISNLSIFTIPLIYPHVN